MKRRERGDRYSATNSKSFKARREEPLIHAGEKERRRNASREAKGNGEERKVAESPEENTARLNNRRRKRKKREERGGERERERERTRVNASEASSEQAASQASEQVPRFARDTRSRWDPAPLRRGFFGSRGTADL